MIRFSLRKMLRNEELTKKLKLEKDIDIPALLQGKLAEPNATTYEDEVSRKLHGFKSRQVYFEKASCSQRIKDIKTPTLCLNALDDPLIRANGIAYEPFKKNPNVALATTKYGGHNSHMEKAL